MDIFKAQITLIRKLPEATSVHDRYFARSEDAIQTFKNILSAESGVSIIAKTEEVYDKRTAMKNGVRIAELRVLKLPLYDTARASLDF
jgi:hypothetical protein